MFELKPCPFCGGNADIMLDIARIGVIVRCEGCGSQTKIYKAQYSSIKSPLKWAITSWDQRVEIKVEEKEN